MYTSKAILAVLSILLLSSLMISAEDAFATAPPTFTAEHTSTTTTKITFSENSAATWRISDWQIDGGNVVITGITNNIGTSIISPPTSFQTSIVLNHAVIPVNSTYNVVYVTGDLYHGAAPNTKMLDATSDIADDKIAPTAPVITAPTTPTNDNTPTITGIAEALSTVKLYNGSTTVTPIATNATLPDGTWSITLPTQIDGTLSLTAIATDAAGNVSPVSSPVPLVIDTPVPKLLSITFEQTTGELVMTFDKVVTVSSVQLMLTRSGFFIESSSSGSVTLSTSTILTTSADAAIMSMTLPAADIASVNALVPLQMDIVLTQPTIVDINGKSIDNITNFPISIVDNTPPTAPVITTPTTPTNDNTPTITGIAEALSTVKLYNGSTTVTPIATNATLPDGTWSITLPTQSDDTLSLIATATDAAGNVSPVSLSVPLVIDTTPALAPSAPNLIDSSDTGFSITDNMTNDATPTFNGTGEPLALVELFADTNAIGKATIASGSTLWTITSNATLTDGTYTITAKQTDAVGNAPSIASTSITVTTDGTSPVLSPIGSKSITENLLLSFTASTTDSSTMRYTIDDASKSLGASIDITTGVFTWTPTNAQTGTHTITVTVTDLAGNFDFEPITVTVDKRKSGGSDDNAHKTRPTFGLDHKTGLQLIEGGFSFNGVSHDITDNFWTPFAEQEVLVGDTNTFTIKTFADKSLKVQEFLFGIPEVGMAQHAELGVEIFYGYDGTVEDIKVIQKSDVIDAESVKVITFDSKCTVSDDVEKCNTTQLTMKFLEPLKDKVMALKAIDFKNRYQITYLNDGFDVTGDSLNPMNTVLIAGTEKYEKPITLTQDSKYSNTWSTEDGRTFTSNQYDTFTWTNETHERTTDTGEIKNRLHSEFATYKDGVTAKAIIQLLEMCPTCLDSFTDFDDSFAYTFPDVFESKTDNPELQEKMILENEKAREIIHQIYSSTYGN